MKNIFKSSGYLKTAFLLIIIIFLLSFQPTFGQLSGDTGCDPNKQLCNPIKFNSIPEFFEEVLKIAAQIGTVVIILGLVYTGFLFVTARGNQDELTKAKQAFTYTVIGAAIVLGAWAFSVAITNTINTITNKPVPSQTNRLQNS